MVKNVAFSAESNIELEMIHSEGPELKPAQIMADIFKVDADNIEKIKVLKVKQIRG